MKFPDDAPVTPEKLAALRDRIAALQINLEQIEASYIRCSGPGGQKVNKTSCGVHLYYAPLDITVKWTRERSRALNRFLALREMVDEIEVKQNPEGACRLSAQQKIARQKARRRRRGNKAHEQQANSSVIGETND